MWLQESVKPGADSLKDNFIIQRGLQISAIADAGRTKLLVRSLSCVFVSASKRLVLRSTFGHAWAGPAAKVTIQSDRMPMVMSPGRELRRWSRTFSIVPTARKAKR
jgi:hypothetical protein